jgi:hypothetical protein
LLDNPIINIETQANLQYNYGCYPEKDIPFNHIVNIESIIGTQQIIADNYTQAKLFPNLLMFPYKKSINQIQFSNLYYLQIS